MEFLLFFYFQSNHKKCRVIDGKQISDITISSLKLTKDVPFLFKMAVLDDAKHKGGFTLFGKNFGNYNQDIKFRVFYEKKRR